jgi:ABC-type multidrug transport system fused ATPase/permease subunit
MDWMDETPAVPPRRGRANRGLAGVPGRYTAALARLSGEPSARRAAAFIADQGRVIATLVVLSVVGSLAVAVGPFVLRHLIDDSLPSGRPWDLVVPVLSLGALLLFEAAVLSWRMALIARLGAVVKSRIRRAANDHLQALPFSFFPRGQQGDVLAVLSSDTQNATHATAASVQAVICRVSDITVGLIVVFVLDWRLSLAVMFFGPATLVVIRGGRTRLAVLARRQQERDGEQLGQIVDTTSVSGALHVRLFNRVDYERDRFDALGEKVVAAAAEQARLTARVRFGVTAGIVATLMVVVALGAWLLSSGRTTMGTVAALGGALLVSFGPLSSAVDLRGDLADAGASYRRIFGLLDTPIDPGPAASHAVSRVTIRAASQAACPGPPELVFDDVWFSYEPVGDAWALRGTSLRVAAGATTAVVGSSGAGKTTITHLASGIYHPQRGSVRLNGEALRDVPPAELHATIGVVAQDPHLFHDTIAANLRYGRLDATDDELWAALDSANLLDLVESLPDGLATVVGARGYRLSGGERQRLAIARVLLQSPSVLILDEATSALDTISEAMVRSALDRLSVGRTCLVIAHRLSTVIDANQIFVLDAGQVIEQGTHAELVGASGAYSRLYAGQVPA